MGIIKFFTDILLDLLYPSYCLSCGKFLLGNHKFISCTDCWETFFKEFKGKKCRNCGYPIELYPGTENFCKRCLLTNRKFAFDSVDYYAIYSGLVDLSIKELKFRKIKPVAYEIGKEISPFLKKFLKENKIEAVIPVPLHDRELEERGFNQCEEILKGAGIPFKNLIRKEFYTAKQSSLSVERRKDNVKGIFSVSQPVKLKRVCVFDDIFTTGATLNEISLKLKEAGVEFVAVFTVARAVKSGAYAPE